MVMFKLYYDSKNTKLAIVDKSMYSQSIIDNLISYGIGCLLKYNNGIFTGTPANILLFINIIADSYTIVIM